MTITPQPPYFVRDAIAGDLPGCIELSPAYDTPGVWQMSMTHDDPSGAEIRFRRERLPRTLTMTPVVPAAALRTALHEGACFLVAADRTGQPLGYLVMRPRPGSEVALIDYVVVDAGARRQGIGRRLIGAARVWCREHALADLQIVLTTKNCPGIDFVMAVGFSLCGFNDRYIAGREIALFFNQSLR